MRHSTRTRRVLSFVALTLVAVLVGALFVGALFVGAGPASAGGIEDSPSPGGGAVPGNGYGAQSDDGQTVSSSAGGCHIVSTVNNLGATCPGSQLTGRKGIKKLMAGETFHKCWYDRFTAEEHQSTGYYDSDTQSWYMKRCLEGIDETTLKVTGTIYVTQDPVPVPNGTTLVTIGPNQQKLVEGFSKTIPYPFAVVSPMDRARVGSWLSFADGQTKHRVDVPALGVLLSAVEDQITVKPLGAGNAATKVCPGSGHIATVGETPVPDGSCWYRYLKSSADQPDNLYPVVISAHWTVTVTDATGTRVLNDFTKSQVTRIPVTEIQAINVQ